MIARIWTGAVRAGDAAAYLDLMQQVAIPDYRSIAGNEGAWCLHRAVEDRVQVSMLTFWRDMDAIKGFAGSDVDKAKYYDFDADYLVEAPDRVIHFEVAGHAALGNS